MYVLGYLGIAFLMWLWEAFIGLDPNDKYYGDMDPTLIWAFIFWPITIPLFSINALYIKLNTVRTNRFIKNEQKAKVRIAAQQELEKYNREVEEEVQNILNERKDSNQA